MYHDNNVTFEILKKKLKILTIGLKRQFIFASEYLI